MDNSVCIGQQYLHIITDPQLVFHQDNDSIWLLVSDLFMPTIKSLDLQFIQCRGDDTETHAKLLDIVVPSLKMAPSGKFNILKIKLRSNTEIYGDIQTGEKIRVILSVNYTDYQLIWNAVKIKASADATADAQAQDFLQECQLEQKLIKI
jgi:hypothetical protein